MKKRFAMVVAAIMSVALLCSCGSKTEITNVSDVTVEDYVTLGEYKGINVTIPKVVIDEAEHAEFVKYYYDYLVTSEYGVHDRAVVDGDTVNIDFNGRKASETEYEESMCGTNSLLDIGSGAFIEGFEEGLIGLMPGESVTLNLTFPEDYHVTELQLVDAVFDVTLNFIIPDEMVDEVVANAGEEGLETVEDLEKFIYDYMYEEYKNQNSANVETEVLATFINNCTFTDVPQDLLDAYRKKIEKSIAEFATNYGYTDEELVFAMYGMTLEDFYASETEAMVNESLAYKAVANAEGLNITDEELDEILNEYVTMGGFNSIEEFLEGGDKEDYREYFMLEKVTAFIVDNANIVEAAE